jgi:hypothetical protein
MVPGRSGSVSRRTDPTRGWLGQSPIALGAWHKHPLALPRHRDSLTLALQAPCTPTPNHWPITPNPVDRPKWPNHLFGKNMIRTIRVSIGILLLLLVLALLCLLSVVFLSAGYGFSRAMGSPAQTWFELYALIVIILIPLMYSVTLLTTLSGARFMILGAFMMAAFIPSLLWFAPRAPLWFYLIPGLLCAFWIWLNRAETKTSK